MLSKVNKSNIDLHLQGYTQSAEEVQNTELNCIITWLLWMSTNPYEFTETGLLKYDDNKLFVTE